MKNTKKKMWKRVNDARVIAKNMDEQYRRIRAENADLRLALDQSAELVDDILGAVAMMYGAEKRNEGELAGYQLRIPIDRIKTAVKNVEMHAGRDDEKGEYIIGAVLREEAK